MCILCSYALIIEEDVQFTFDVDYAELIKSAPKGFGVLQLAHADDYSEVFWLRFLRQKGK